MNKTVPSAAYDIDIVAWADEQAALLRAGKLSQIDIQHIADEVEDVGKSEQRELASRMAVLLVHLLKWTHQPERQGASWRRTITEQRRMIERRLARTPSLRADMRDPEWLADIWSDAVSKAIDKAGLVELPEACPWSRDEILDLDYLPS